MSFGDIVKGALGVFGGASGVGSILSGVGAIAGAFNRPSGPGLAEQYAANLGAERDSFNQKMALAKEHGLHPLAVLGVPMGQSMPAVQVGDTGPDYAQMGYGASQIASSFVKPPDKPEPDLSERRIMDANVRLAEAQANKAEWDALRSEQAASSILMGQPGMPPGVRTSNDSTVAQRTVAMQSGIPLNYLTGKDPLVNIKQDVLPPHPYELGTSAGTDQSWNSFIDKDGSRYSLVGQNVVSADVEMGATFQALAKIYGVERALQLTAILENQGILAGGAAALGLAGKGLYDYFGKQRRDVEKRRGFGPGRGRAGWRAAPRSSD